VFDIVVGSATGAGSFNMLFGGVQAGSGEIPANPFTLGFVGAGSPGGVTSGTPGVGVLGGSTANAAPAAGGAAPPASGGARAATPAASIVPKGARGGALAGVGLAGLAMLAAMAEGDRRKMRRAQREIPFTD
jgi:hypothetical protein